jgi:hypothetical protein
MEKSTLTKHLILAGVLGAGIILVALTTQGQLDPTPPVGNALPDTLGACRSMEVLYCQNEECMTSFATNVTTAATIVCGACETAVDTVSLAEKQMLPRDTRIDRRLYTAPSGRRYTVSVVEGGYERRSIHRPQVCLVAQGNTITKQQRLRVPLPQLRPLELTAMEMNGGTQLFAYWFTDGERQTASHWARLFWIAWDGVIHNERRRWAYIAIVTHSGDTAGAQSDLMKFIPDLYHHIHAPNEEQASTTAR